MTGSLNITELRDFLFAVEIRKYHKKNPLETFYEIEQCKIAVNYKLLLLKLNFYKINRSPTPNPSLTLTPNLLRVRKVAKKSLKNFKKKQC